MGEDEDQIRRTLGRVQPALRRRPLRRMGRPVHRGCPVRPVRARSPRAATPIRELMSRDACPTARGASTSPATRWSTSTATRPPPPPTICSSRPDRGRPGIVAAGRYHDRLVRDGRRWRFRERSITMLGAPERRTRMTDVEAADAPGAGDGAPTAGADVPHRHGPPRLRARRALLRPGRSPTSSGSASGPTSGRWPAGSRRSPSPATSSSTRSAISRSWWSGRRADGQGLLQRLPAPGHRAGQGHRDLPRRADHLPLPRLAMGPRGDELLRLRRPRLRSGTARARGALPAAGPGGHLGRLRLDQPRPGGAAAAGGARPDPEPARPAGRGRHAGGLVEEDHAPGQLEDGPGGVHGGVPRPPDPSPAHPRPPRAVRPGQPGLLGLRAAGTRASSSGPTPRPRRDSRSAWARSTPSSSRCASSAAGSRR